MTSEDARQRSRIRDTIVQEIGEDHPDGLTRLDHLDRREAFELALADVELDRLLAGIPELADPTDIECHVTAVRHAEPDDADVAGIRADRRFLTRVFGAALRNIRERDNDILSSGHAIVSVYELIDSVARESDGGIHRDVTAAIGDPRDGGFLIPLRTPLDVRWVGLLQGLGVRDRVRLLTELVRVLGNLVRFASLGESIRGDLIRCLGDLVGLLRAAVRDARKHPSDEPNDGRATDADPCSSDLIHAISVGEEQR